MAPVYDNPREAVLIGYLAGVMDSEGTFGITRTQPKRYTNLRYSARVTLGMTNRTVVEMFVARYGGTVREERVQNRKTMYRWAKVGDSEQTARIIEELLPHLIVKRQQAQAVLAYIRGKQTKGFQRHHGIPGPELQRREEAYQAVRKLNAVGAPATTE